MQMIRRYLVFFRTVNVWSFLYLNYFSKNVIRNGSGKIIPYKNAIIDLEPGSKIYIQNENLEIGSNKLKGSKAETYVRMRKDASWNAEKGCNVAYGSTIEVLQNATLKTSFFTMNSFSTIIAGKSVKIGNDVMIARNVTILDSDFHEIMENKRTKSKYGQVEIKDHVWIAANSIILKNTILKDGMIVSANTLVTSSTKIDENVILGNEMKDIILLKNVEWKR